MAALPLPAATGRHPRNGAAATSPPPEPLPRFGDGRKGRIGLYGGSFNPAHRGHAHVAIAALQRLRLDALWALVSPQNPLKPTAGMAPLADRLASARRICRHPRITVSAIEGLIGTRYTIDTLAALRRRFPRARFVFIMGADSFAGLHRWRHWRRLLGSVPVAVVPRPGHVRAALASPAARHFARARFSSRRAPLLPGAAPPAWTMLEIRQDESSATRIRAGRPEPIRDRLEGR